MNGDRDSDARGLDRTLNRLAAERSTIFAKGGKNEKLSEAERRRLRVIEQELTETKLAGGRRLDPSEATRR